METPTSASVKVQHITKKSSDELLRKFADDSDNESHKKKKDLRATKRRKKNWAVTDDSHCESPSKCSTALVEMRSLLPPAATRRSALLRQRGIGRAQLRAGGVRNKFLLALIEKTWRRTTQGASRVLLEKHYYRHKLLNNDIA